MNGEKMDGWMDEKNRWKDEQVSEAEQVFFSL